MDSMTSSRFRPLLLSALIAVSICVAAADELKNNSTIDIPGGSGSIPMRLVNGYVIIDAKVNGTGPYPFKFDTVSCVCIDDQLVAKLDLARTGKITGTTPQGNPESATTLSIDSIGIGPVTIHNVSGVKYNLANISSYVGLDVQGIIGLQDFLNCSVRLDYPRSQITVTQNPPAQKDSSGLPIKIVEEMIPTVQIPVGGHTYEFFVNSGYSGAFFFPEKVSPDLPLNAERYQYSPLVVNHGPFYLSTFTRLKGPVKLGSYTLQDPYAGWVNNAPGMTCIGNEILSQFIVDIDMVHKVVRFQHDGTAPITFPNKRRFDVVVQVQNGAARIANITPRLYALNMDLKVGDEVVAIGGAAPGIINDYELKRIWEERGALMLTIRRDGKETIVDIPAPVDTFAETK